MAASPIEVGWAGDADSELTSPRWWDGVGRRGPSDLTSSKVTSEASWWPSSSSSVPSFLLFSSVASKK